MTYDMTRKMTFPNVPPGVRFEHYGRRDEVTIGTQDVLRMRPDKRTSTNKCRYMYISNSRNF